MANIFAIEQITAEWLEQVLHQTGFADAAVSGFSTQRVGTGQAAISCRIGIDYATDRPELPRSVIAKFPSEDPAIANGAAQQGTYMREVKFYQLLQPQLTIRTPRCYFAQIADSGPEFALVLEDLAPADQGDQIAGCDAALARAGVLQLVGLHAPSWNNPAMLAFDWVSYPTLPGRGQRIMQLYRNGLPHFMERCAAALETDELRLLDRLAAQEEFPSEYPLLQAHCLTHNDYRVDNFLIDPGKPAEDMHVVDWQTYGLGNPMRDVSYFLGGCLQPNLRRDVEEDILREYYRALQAAGVTGYAWGQCWSDYGQASYHGIMTAMAAMTFVSQTERGDRLFTVMVQRHARQAIETGAAEALA